MPFYDLLHDFLTWFQTQLNAWVLIGFIGQSMFFMRFICQWVVSERAKKSVVPEVFWYFSLVGGLIVFAYALHKKDIVFILGQGTGILIYLRNIYFVWRHKRTAHV